jgi:hypothetical protein
MTWMSKTREHRARELINLISLATQCANLPDVAEAERRQWLAEARRAWDELHDVLPAGSPWNDRLPDRAG